MNAIGSGPSEDSGWQRALVAQARVGDEDAFETLVRLHQDVAYRVALRMTGSPQDAQDVVQDALLAAWRGLPAFRSDSLFGTWLVRIVINRCHNLSRAEHPTQPLRDEEPDTRGPATDTAVVTQHHHDAAIRAVMALPFDQRAALVLHTFSGHTYAQVGGILGISESAAKVRVHRARRALVTRLQDWR
ncbi:RNA polymerase sigma-70 factor, ECF subfamily [Sanguibacter gelidistatuariae]|uniref:RNA polymerase sigma factor n=1 Tax=Sanguibacter gelidistatuariae TaxID=1814289 RepID=A0A1G6GS61_9MICO|nr:RNA polymerase sigma factor [Sanguibacter gelidistatuariae]SDB84827.1 RNA polymerase sigma-70 factor, ECF subfamily [Sanguibacter gelidistatuariae]